MTVKEFFSFKSNRYFWVNIIAMAGIVMLLLFVTFKGLDSYTRHGETVVVPNVKDMTVEEASKMLRNQGLEGVVSDSSYVRNRPAGIILELSPGIGQKVKEGRVIYLTINTLNVPLGPIPDVADNSSFRQAQAKVLAAGFKLNEVQLVSGEKDWVYGVRYQGRLLTSGEKIPLGASLTLMIGNGAGDSIEVDSTEMSRSHLDPTTSESSHTQDDSWF